MEREFTTSVYATLEDEESMLRFLLVGLLWSGVVWQETIAVNTIYEDTEGIYSP